MGNSTKDSGIERSGYIPAAGYITGQELADRLRLKDYKHLQEQLANNGIVHATLGSKRVYRLKDLERLFFE